MWHNRKLCYLIGEKKKVKAENVTNIKSQKKTEVLKWFQLSIVVMVIFNCSLNVFTHCHHNKKLIFAANFCGCPNVAVQYRQIHDSTLPFELFPANLAQCAFCLRGTGIVEDTVIIQSMRKFQCKWMILKRRQKTKLKQTSAVLHISSCFKFLLTVRKFILRIISVWCFLHFWTHFVVYDAHVLHNCYWH